MRTKKLLLLTVPLMACMTLLFSPPSDVSAAPTVDTINLNDRSTWPDPQRDTIIIGQCIGECHHVITGTFDARTITHDTTNAVVQVEGGPHNITFDNANISLTDSPDDDVHVRAFALGDTAVVNLTLKGNNTLKSAGAKAALFVPKQASLTIFSEKGQTSTLTSTSGFGAAGIGGDSNNGDCGNITINAPDSTITASSSARGAGIGGGLNGKAGKIVIEAGTVNATGGRGIESEPAGVGIGSNYLYPPLNNDVVIRGGNVTATGGTTTQNTGNVLASAIRGGSLSSSTGSIPPEEKSVTITAVGGVSGDTKNFNGLVWGATGNVNEGRVYGDAILTENVNKGQKITIPAGTSLTPKYDKSDPDAATILNYGVIEGGGLLIDPKRITSPDFGTSPQIPMNRQRVSLERAAVTPSKSTTDNDKAHYPYNGENQLDSIIDIVDELEKPVGSNDWYPVESTGWNKIIKEENVTTKLDLKDAGTYYIIFERKDFNSFSVGPIYIDKVALTPEMITITKAYSYTGDKLTPELSVKLPNGHPLEEGTDYTIESVTDTDKKGTAKVTIKAKGVNYSGTATKEFNINAASIANADVQIDDTPFTYNANKQVKEPVVILDGKTLSPDTDYDVTYSPADCTDAGTITITVTGKGNYTDTAKKVPTYDINKKPITITKLTAAERKYEKGITTVDVTAEYGKDDLEGNDKPADVTIESKGTITSDEVGEYASVTFAEDPLTLGGNKGGNYILNNPGGDIILTPAVKITQADAPATPDLDTTTYTLDSAHADRFVYTATVTNPDERVTYEYRLNDTDLPDDQGWQDSPVFDNIEPTSTHTFEVRSKADKNIKQSKTGIKDITFTKLKNPDKPGAITLTPTPNRDNETFTETISSETKWENVEFFIGEKGEEPVYSDSNDAYVKKDCEANTEYIGYVRYKETATHQASDPVTATNRTDMRPVSKPVISPGDGTTFVEDTLEVTIKCKTKGADIYYTIDDGSENSTDEPIKYDGPFLIGEELPGETTITINAYATKNNMTDSEPADEVKITKKLPYIETPVISLKDSEETEFDHKGQEVTISCETEEVDIYYTLDGTDPTRESEKYSSRKAIKIDDTTTVKAFAVKEDKTMNDSPIATADFTRIWLTVATPEIHPEEDVEVAGSKQVRLECNTEDATIYYTTDGNDPTPENSTKYKGKPFRVNAPATVKAYAVKDDMLDSAIASVVINQSDSMIEVHSKLDPFIQDDEDERHPLLTPELKEKLLERKEIERIEGDELAVAEYLMTRELDVKGYAGDFVPTNMKFYNLKMWIKIGEKIIDKPVIDDFPAEGYTITVPYPTEVAAMAGARPEAKWEDYNYAIAHMVSEGENVGEDIDTWYGEQITKTPYGLQISITSASPFAIAWTTSQNEEVNNKLGDGIPAAPEDPGTQPGDPSTDNPDDSQPMVTPNPSPDSPGGDGAPSGGGSTGAGAVADAIKSALSSVLPKTGDTNKIIAWIVVLVASVAVIVGLRIKSKKSNTKGKGKTKKH